MKIQATWEIMLKLKYDIPTLKLTFQRFKLEFPSLKF